MPKFMVDGWWWAIDKYIYFNKKKLKKNKKFASNFETFAIVLFPLLVSQTGVLWCFEY